MKVINLGLGPTIYGLAFSRFSHRERFTNCNLQINLLSQVFKLLKMGCCDSPSPQKNIMKSVQKVGFYIGVCMDVQYFFFPQKSF